MKELVIESLCKSYGRTTVLNEVNLSYQSGSINGVIGANGAGKSTLLHCMAGFIPYAGEVVRKDIHSIGLLTANPYMFPRITGREFVEFSVSAKRRKMDRDQLNKLNRLFELPLDRFADEYSTGMLKKLHLLAILLQDNDLLLLDEPFNGLDIMSSAILLELLSEWKKRDTLIIVSSHDFSQLAKMADTITVIQNNSAYMRKESLSEMEEEFRSAARSKIGETFH